MLKVILFIFLTLYCISSYADSKAWDPESRPDQWWQQAHQHFLEETKKEGKDIEIIFYGDSITQGWSGNGHDVWEKNYAHIHSVNYGIGGDRTQHIIWRLEHNEVNGLKPKLIVLKIGTNNLWSDSDDDIVHGIKTILDIMHMKLPDTKVLLLGILPRGDMKVVGKLIMDINSKISKFANGNTIQYLDMGPHFMTHDGHIIEKLYVNDKLHLSKDGYEVWAETMGPLFKKMLQ